MSSTFFPRDPLLTTSLKTTFRLPFRGGEDHRPPVGPGPRWRHRGGVQNALGGTLRIILGAGNGPLTFPLPHVPLFGRHSGLALPNQPPLPPDADWCGTTRAVPEQRGTFPSAGLRMCPTHGVASPLLRCGSPQGSLRLVQGRRWIMVAWQNQCEHDGGWSVPGPIPGRPGADQALSLPPARYTTSTEAVRGFRCL